MKDPRGKEVNRSHGNMYHARLLSRVGNEGDSFRRMPGRKRIFFYHGEKQRNRLDWKVWCGYICRVIIKKVWEGFSGYRQGMSGKI